MLLTLEEAQHAGEAFLTSVYGAEIMERWQNLKEKMNFMSERDFCSWLLEVGNEYINREDEVDGSFIESDLCDLNDLKNGEAQSGSSLLSPPGNDMSEPNDPSSDVWKQGNLPSEEEENKYLPSSEELELISSPPSEGVASPVNQEQIKLIYCPHCPYKTSQKWNLNKHVSVVHHKNKPHSCTLCNFQTTTRHHLQRHLVSRHGFVGRFQCDKCEKSFNYEYGLNRHVSAVHNADKPHSCSLCDFQTTTKHHLQSHLVSRHGFVGNFQCSKCEKNFTWESQLKTHLKSCCGNA